MFLKLSFKSNKKTFAEANIKLKIVFGVFCLSQEP